MEIVISLCVTIIYAWFSAGIIAYIIRKIYCFSDVTISKANLNLEEKTVLVFAFLTEFLVVVCLGFLSLISVILQIMEEENDNDWN
jgi:hypothetical protein